MEVLQRWPLFLQRHLHSQLFLVVSWLADMLRSHPPRPAFKGAPKLMQSSAKDELYWSSHSASKMHSEATRSPLSANRGTVLQEAAALKSVTCPGNRMVCGPKANMLLDTNYPKPHHNELVCPFQ